jgi:hypothetical protein
VLIYLVLIATLFSSMIYGIERDYLLKPVSHRWNWVIRALITFGILLMFIHGLMFGFKLYYSYLIEVFVIIYLAIGAELRKKMLGAAKPVEKIQPRPSVRPKPAVPRRPVTKAVKPKPKITYRAEDPFDKMAREFEEWKNEKRKRSK